MTGAARRKHAADAVEAETWRPDLGRRDAGIWQHALLSRVHDVHARKCMLAQAAAIGILSVQLRAGPGVARRR